MRNLINIIDEYLNKPTDFAVQIVGSWGYGKTHFYRNSIESQIYNKSTYNNSSKKYKPIYISLFGLKSIEDVATKIVLDFYQSKSFKVYFKKTLTKKRLKITQSVFKIGLRGFLKFNRLGNVNDYLTDIKTIGENALDTNELVICFDDWERKDSSLKIEDLTGYINSIVEEGIKVLIISNENLLLKEGEVYKNLKEKIIGISIEFIPNTKETLLNIIKLRYSAFPFYLQYLTENIEEIIKLAQAIDNNFRHIIYALDSLHHCYSKIKNDIIDSKHEICEKVILELKNISILTLAFAVEFKLSAIKYLDIQNYKEEPLLLNEIFSINQQNNFKTVEEEKTKLEKFLAKYDIAKKKYHLYESIYNYVTGYDEFNIESFKLEFKKIFKLEQGQILPQYELFNALSYPNCFNLSDEEYREKTLALIDNAKNGQYAAEEYLSVMQFAERFNNILDLNLEEVKGSLIIGLQKIINNFPTSNDLSFNQFRMRGRFDELSNVNKKLYNEGMEELKLFQERQIREKIGTIANLFTSDFTEFEKQHQVDNNFKLLLENNPFLNYVNIEELLKKIKIANGQTLNFLSDFFKDRYESTDKLKAEVENLKKFTKQLIDYRQQLICEPRNKIRSFLISEFTESIIAIRDKAVQLYESQTIDQETRL
jgi:hypothetical protein